MKNHLPASKRITAMLCSLFLLAAVFVSEVSAQVDTAFWFAVPYVNVHHGINIVQNKGDFFGGADPLYFKISTLDVDDADVEITMPAHGDTVLFSKHIPKGSTVTYTIPRELRFKIMQDRLGDKIEDKGIYIKSNAFITVYYENATVQNPDLFSLKGKNALGKIFFTPFQTRWPNDPRHNTNFMSPLDQYWPNADGVPTSYTKINKDLNTDGRVQLTNYDSIPGVYFTVDSAYSAFDIVATEDGTRVRITPTSAVFGHAAGVPYEITLNKGQTYSARAMSQGIESTKVDNYLTTWRSSSNYQPHNYALTVVSNKKDNNLSGSKVEVIAGGKIAVTVRDDSVFENAEANSYSGSGEDFLGDQLVPIDYIGTEYIVITGQLQRKDVKEHCFIVATVDGTTISVNGVDQKVILSAGQTYDLLLNPDATSPVNNSIVTNKDVYVLQTTGFNMELAAAILPPINLCTGSYQVGFTRTYGGNGDQQDSKGRKFFMNVLVRKGTGTVNNKDGFAILTNGSEDANATNKIRQANFVDVPGNSKWQAAKIEFSESELSNGAHVLKNSMALFHMGLINATSYTFGSGYVLTGSEYGYFSNYNEAIPNAFIVQNGVQKKEAYYDVIKREDIRLFAEGGVRYDWNKFEKYNYKTSKWDDLNIGTQIKPSRTYYRPSITAPADTGFYRIVVDITNDCHEGIDTLLVRVIIGPKSNTDTVCTTKFGLCESDGYNLANLNQFGHVLSKTQIASGMYIDSWYYRNQKVPYVLQNYEGLSKVSTVSYYNSIASFVVNPSIEAVNYSSSTMLLTKNASVGVGNANKSAYATYTLNPTLDLTAGNMFSYRYMYAGDPISDVAQLNSFKVYAVLLNAGKVVDSIELNVMASKIQNPEWSLGEFYFNAVKGSVTQVRVGFYSDATTPVKFYFDELERNDPGVWDSITDATNHTLKNCVNVVYAKVKNTYVKDYVDYAPQYVWVKEEGRKTHDITEGPKCIKEAEPVCIRLIDYDSLVHDNIIGEREWFTSLADIDYPSKAIDKSETRCLLRDTVFYAVVRDQCHKVSTLSFKITAIPRLKYLDTTITLCADQVFDPSGKTKQEDITRYESAYFTNPLTKYTFSWYSDVAKTKLITDPTRVIVANSLVLYGSVNASGKTDCSMNVTLKFIIHEKPEMSFRDTAYCEDITAQDFDKSLARGLFIIGTDTVADFKPSLYAGRKVDVVYSYLDKNTCQWYDTAQFSVHKAPVASIAPHDTIQYGLDLSLDASVTTGSGDYDYTWSNDKSSVNKIVDPKVQDVSVHQMFDKDSFSLVVVDRITGCDDTAHVIVNVKGIPLKVAIVLPTTPLCETRSQYLKAVISGGVGPYSLKWLELNVERPSSKELIDSILISPTKTTTYTVSVTDHGDREHAIDTFSVVTVYPNPVINAEIVAKGATVCQNTPLTLNGSATGGTGALDYKWSGADAALLTTPTMSNPKFDSKTEPKTYTFRCIVTDEKSCSDTADIKVDVLKLPELGIADKQVVCSGHNLTLDAATTSGTTPYTYIWTGDVANLNFADQGLVVFNKQSAVAATSLLKVKVTDDNKCADSLDITVAVNPLPVSNITGDEKGVCKNAVMKVAAEPVSSAYSYLWKSANSKLGTSQTLDFNLTTVATSVPLNLIVTDIATGCSDSVLSMVAVHELPTVAVFGADSNKVCVNADLKLEARASSTPAGSMTYIWTPVTNISPADARNVTFKSSTVGATPISVTVTDERECKSTATHTVSILDRPVYTKPAVSTICTQLDYDFDLNIASGNKVTWTGDLSVLKNNPAGATPRFYATEAGVFTVNYVVSDGFCTSTDVVTLNVNLRPDVSVANYEACESVIHSINAELTPKTQSLSVGYAWTENGQALASSTSMLSYKSAVKGNHNLKVIASANNGCSDTAVFTVNVNENPTASIVSNLSPASGNKVPYDKTLNLSARATGGTPVYTSYDWTSSAVLTPEEAKALEITYPKFQSPTNVSYTLTVTDSKNCKGVASQTYYTIPPTVIKPTDRSLCEGSRTVISPVWSDFGDSDKMQYAWYVNGVKLPFTGVSLNFVPSDYAKKPLETGDVLTVRFEATNGEMLTPKSDSIKVTVNPNPVPVLTVATVAAEDKVLKEFYFTNEVPSVTKDDVLTYKWSGDLAAGLDSILLVNDSLKYVVPAVITAVNPTIALRVEDNHGCIGSSSYGVNQLRVFVETICEDTLATYTFKGLPEGSVLVFDNKPQDWTQVDATTFTAFWPKGGVYPFTVTATNIDSKILIVGDTITQFVNSYPDVNIIGLADVCVGQTKPYEVETTQSGLVTWSLGKILESTNSIVSVDPVYGKTIDATWNRIGLDTLSVTVDNLGCKGSDYMFVNTHANPLAEFKYAPVNDILIGTEVAFANNSTGEKTDSDLSFYWDFVGEGVFTSEQTNPTYKYQDMGVYPVHLIAYDNSWGCLDTAIVNVTVLPNPDCSMDYPNTMIISHSNPKARVFYPFNRVGVLEEGYTLKIFNQWGAMVWETNDINAQWDGYYNGSLVAQAVYVFQSEATCENGKLLKQNGDVTVLR